MEHDKINIWTYVVINILIAGVTIYSVILANNQLAENIYIDNSIKRKNELVIKRINLYIELLDVFDNYYISKILIDNNDDKISELLSKINSIINKFMIYGTNEQVCIIVDIYLLTQELQCDIFDIDNKATGSPGDDIRKGISIGNKIFSAADNIIIKLGKLSLLIRNNIQEIYIDMDSYRLPENLASRMLSLKERQIKMRKHIIRKK